MESCNPDQESGLQAAWEHLGNAVVERAVLDYIRAVKALRAHPEDEAVAAMVRDCEDFFCTNRIQLFSTIDGRALLEDLRRDVQGQHLGGKAHVRCNGQTRCPQGGNRPTGAERMKTGSRIQWVLPP